MKTNSIFSTKLLFTAVLAACAIRMADEDTAGGTILDLDNVEDMDFDKIEEAAGFVNPPDGLYILHLDTAKVEKYKTKEEPDTDRQRIAHYYSIVAVQELTDSEEQEPKNGSKFSERFMFNEKGLGFWKNKATSILGQIGEGMKLGGVLAELNAGDYNFLAKIQNKKSQGKDGKEYTNCNVRVVKRLDAAEVLEAKAAASGE